MTRYLIKVCKVLIVVVCKSNAYLEPIKVMDIVSCGYKDHQITHVVRHIHLHKYFFFGLFYRWCSICYIIQGCIIQGQPSMFLVELHIPHMFQLCMHKYLHNINMQMYTYNVILFEALKVNSICISFQIVS